MIGQLLELDVDEPARELPHGADGVCDACGRPGVLEHGECERCRLCACGAPASHARASGELACDDCLGDELLGAAE